MKLFIIFSLIFITFNAIDAGKINCDFSEHKNGYACQAKDLETYRIEGVNGVHLPNKTTKDVKYFDATSKSLQFLPRWLHFAFPNLQHISIDGQNFSEILRSDLQPFGENLRTLSLANTKLEDLPLDLFKDTPNLGHLNLQSNEFKHLDANMFQAVPKLFFLSVNFPCHKADKFNNGGEIQKAIKNLDLRCYTKNFVHHDLNRHEIECMSQEGCGPENPPKEELLIPTSEKPPAEKNGANSNLVVVFGITVAILINALI